MTRTAQSWTEVGACPLSRRDRAAMELALCVLCTGYPTVAIGALEIPGRGAASDVWEAAELAYLERVPRRALIARLALALRVLLRVDRGDYGPPDWRSWRYRTAEDRITVLRGWLRQIATWREDCHANDEDMGDEPRDFDEDTVAEIERNAAYALRNDDGESATARRPAAPTRAPVRPLWEDAPAHDGRGPRERRAER